ncbi:MAG: cell division protein FtsL [Pseudomonadaceae bacterium]|nr:cell division protein FtsL [Pseudomonadaceae bacterium]
MSLLAGQPPKLRTFLLGIALLIATVATAVQVTLQADAARDMARALDAAQKQKEHLLAERSRLLLERGALAAYQNVDRVAESELGMRFPQRPRRVLVASTGELSAAQSAKRGDGQ